MTRPGVISCEPVDTQSNLARTPGWHVPCGSFPVTCFLNAQLLFEIEERKGGIRIRTWRYIPVVTFVLLSFGSGAYAQSTCATPFTAVLVNPKNGFPII